MARKIEVDDDVYGLLQRHAPPFSDAENDVLRRLLFGDGSGTTTNVPTAGRDRGRPGQLMPYLDAGLLDVGDELVHVQPRKGVVHRARVTPDGRVEVDGHPPFEKVSPALKVCVGHEINGWGQWNHTRSGRRLQEFRDELLRMQEDR